MRHLRQDRIAQGHTMATPKGVSTSDDQTGALLLGGMAAGTCIRTLDGLLPVEYLEPGDRIVTRSGARRLVAVSVVVRRAHDVVRIRAATLGHDRPESDLRVGPAQGIVVRDWRAQALYGSDMAAIPAARLADGEFVIRERQTEVRLFTLRFAEDEIIWADGLELACPAMVPAARKGSLGKAISAL
jgi:hypothetical protein